MGGGWDRLVTVPLPGPALVVEWLWDLGGAFKSPLFCLVPPSRGAASGEAWQGSGIDSGHPEVQSAAPLLLIPYMPG